MSLVIVWYTQKAKNITIFIATEFANEFEMWCAYPQQYKFWHDNSIRYNIFLVFMDVYNLLSTLKI